MNRCAQLDQNLSSRKLIDACNQSGGVTPLPIPDPLKGKEDRLVLQELLPLGNIIVTNDLGIAEENCELLATLHPGLLIIDQDDNAPATMTWKIALRILRDIKEQFTHWHNTPWNNSIITLRPSHIEVQIVDAGELKRTAFIDRATEGWQESLEATLQLNSEMGQA